MGRDQVVFRDPKYGGEKFALLIPASTGPFSGAKLMASYVDGVAFYKEGDSIVSVEGYRNVADGKETVVVFPYGVQFYMVPRERVKLLSMADAAKARKEQEDAVDKALGQGQPAPGAADAIVGLSDPGQYL